MPGSKFRDGQLEGHDPCETSGHKLSGHISILKYHHPAEVAEKHKVDYWKTSECYPTQDVSGKCTISKFFLIMDLHPTAGLACSEGAMAKLRRIGRVSTTSRPGGSKSPRNTSSKSQRITKKPCEMLNMLNPECHDHYPSMREIYKILNYTINLSYHKYSICHIIHIIIKDQKSIILTSSVTPKMSVSKLWHSLAIHDTEILVGPCR